MWKRYGARLVGFEGTSASVSFCGGVIELPDYAWINFTVGSTWDENNKIKLESNE